MLRCLTELVLMLKNDGSDEGERWGRCWRPMGGGDDGAHNGSGRQVGLVMGSHGWERQRWGSCWGAMGGRDKIGWLGWRDG